MVTDDERRRVAERLRSLAGGYVTIGEMEDALGICMSSPIVDLERDARDLNRLADLIEPDTTSDTTKSAEDTTKATTSSDTASTSSDTTVTHTDASATCDMSQSRRDNVACDPTVRGIDSIYEWCFSGLEGADGDEDYLYCTIMSAIEEYRHPERVTARTARAVDRDALLALADDLDYAGANMENVAYIDQTFHESARRIREAMGVGR